ncbi:MAG: WD40-repeat-containing domain protein [Linnemannia gamsii]|nr:MAG: WD40-repeat-containing domain protein [Linnemannia gamsii]
MFNLTMIFQLLEAVIFHPQLVPEFSANYCQEILSDVFQYTGYRRTESFCQESFERAIGLYHRTPQRPIPSWISMQKTTSVRSLLGLRELGRARTPLIKDQMLLHMTKAYRPVTSFNFSSGSVVDVALKTSTMKLAIANIATQDTYNRKGNLFLCDLDKGVSKKLEGHTRFDQRLNQEMEVTVNDIKLSNSQNFFISGSDDHKTMIWNAETGALMNTIGEHTSRVTRVAIVEHSRDGQDVFATGSADGTIKIYALDNEGLISVGNGVLARNGFTGKRCISSISFGYHHFWDCLAVGFEGADGQDGVGARQGLIAIYDANTIQKVMDGDLGYRHGAQRSTEKSVSCLSFSPSGSQLVCGTSGRSSAEDDEKGDRTLRVIDLQTSKMVESAVSGHEDVNLVDFSPCMRYLISGSNTNETAVFDRRNLKRALHRLCHSPRNDEQGHAGITSALWWPSSCGTSQSMLMTGGGDETVRLWDLRRASEDTEIWNMDTNIGPIARMIAPSSMEHLIVGSDTGAVNIYSIDDGMVAKYKNNGMTLLNDDEV